MASYAEASSEPKSPKSKSSKTKLVDLSIRSSDNGGYIVSEHLETPDDAYQSATYTYEVMEGALAKVEECLKKYA